MARAVEKYVKRVQSMFTERQYELLREYAEATDTPVSTLVRKTVEDSLITDLEQRRKQKALDWMASQHLPVDDWEVMERQIGARWEEDEHE
jgi:hypothetical protein